MQSLGLVALTTPENFPTEHSVHLETNYKFYVSNGSNIRADYHQERKQNVHAYLDWPVLLEKYPSGHRVHEDSPSLGENCPFKHTAHISEPIESLNFPLGQFSHTSLAVAPSSSLYFPLGHLLQSFMLSEPSTVR